MAEVSAGVCRLVSAVDDLVSSDLIHASFDVVSVDAWSMVVGFGVRC